MLLRRTFPELERTLIKRSRELYPRLGGWYREGSKTWTFPGGETVGFGYCESDNDVLQYQGAEFQYVGVDELTAWNRKPYIYLLSRIRSARGVRCRARATTNPGGVGHEWVFERWGNWLDTRDSFKGIRGIAGEPLFFRARGDSEEVVPFGTPLANSRSFIPSKLSDNPYLANTGYAEQLEMQDAVTRAQLKDGDWIIRPAAGMYFKRLWFKFVMLAADAPSPVPAGAKRVRYWDRASTEVSKGRSDPDWTIGWLMAKALVDPQNRAYHYFVEDVLRTRGSPQHVEGTIRATAALDGRAVTVGIEQDPGSAGVFEAEYYVRALQGFRVELYRPTRDKVTRAGPASSQVEHGHVTFVVREGSNLARVLPEVMAVLEGFPDPNIHDDDVDAFSGCFAALHKPPPARGTMSYTEG